MTNSVKRLLIEKHSERLLIRKINFHRRLKAQSLLVRGDLGEADFKKPAIAVIGTRRPSARGIRFVREFIPALAAYDCVVLSGGALGIDGEVHAAALQNGLPTQAWLVGPILQPSPASHRRLFESLASTPRCGLLVPENIEPSDARPTQKRDWVERNQWLVAASDALIVVEAKRPSGTWSSVQAAHDYGIPVFLLQGPDSSPQSFGVNQMILEGYGKGVQTIKELTKSLVVELGTSFYNDTRNPKWLSGQGGELADLRELRLNKDLLASLRQILNNVEGLNWETALTVSREQSLSEDEMLRHLAWMLNRGEIQRSGDRFERRG